MSSDGRRISIRGTVQGVGFRPWVYRLAHEEDVAGTVRNDPTGVIIEAFGTEPSISRFLRRLAATPPPAAVIRALDSEPIRASRSHPQHGEFTIVQSTPGVERQYSVAPDLATCPDCLEEVFSPLDRRFRYPFINCTNCGPRFTITRDLPYDRPATTMAGFGMCPACADEYENPLDRRFHAQPNACRVCGPRVELVDAHSVRLSIGTEALLASAMGLRRGWILALKGLGGFQLMAVATDEAAVRKLRRRKHRAHKPLAIMVRSLEDAAQFCEINPTEADLLTSPAAPIVLLRRRQGANSRLRISSAVAPGNPRLGVMLPTTPLHHLLLSMVVRPIVATSGNLTDEPICIDNGQAVGRLGSIADVFLVHDRPIVRHADDSVVIVDGDHTQLLRRARGYAPQPITVERQLPQLLAVGGHMKNVVAVSQGQQVILSQHIGDMETPQAVEAFETVIADLLRMVEAQPVALVHDLHPDYPSTLWAQHAVTEPDPRGTPALECLCNLPTIAIQHHHAHFASCLADNDVQGSALGITFDGTGYGTDKTIWGGECLLGDAADSVRVASLRPFRLLGGEIATREPRRCALAILADVFGIEIFDNNDLPPLADLGGETRSLFAHLLESGLRSPRTTSAGRLFDAVAALIGLRQHASFEGQAAMELEHAADPAELGAYPFRLTIRTRETQPLIELDWRPAIEMLVSELRAGISPALLSARFHNGLADAIAGVAHDIQQPRVALSGGCFQNALLTHRTRELLEEDRFEVLLHRRVPANDGGIALGQIIAAAARIEHGEFPEGS